MTRNKKITIINEFKIRKATTNLFENKNEKVFSTILYDFVINGNKIVDKHYLKLLMEHIRNNDILKKYDIKTKNQHYLKQEIQARWENRIIIHNKNKNVVYSGFELLSDIEDNEQKKFKTEKIGTADHTFTYFNNKAITYNENGIVTLIEDTICLFENKDINDIDDIYFKILSHFCSGSLWDRKKAIYDFSEKLTNYLLSNNSSEVNIDKFIKKNLTKTKTIKVYKSENEIFSLNNEWSAKINLEGINWDLLNIIPINPNTAILICDSEKRLSYVISEFKRLESLNKLDTFLLLNAMINEMERLYSLDSEKGQIIEDYFKNSIIGIPNKNVYYKVKDLLSVDAESNTNKEDIERLIYILINLM